MGLHRNHCGNTFSNFLLAGGLELVKNSVQPHEKIYDSYKMFCDPIMARIMNLANNAQTEEEFMTIVVIMGRTSPQYLTAGFSSPGARIGVTTCTMRRLKRTSEPWLTIYS
jgi:hypothetical protein